MGKLFSVALLAAVGLLSGGVTATAEPAVASSTLSVEISPDFAAVKAGNDAYWTAERMRNAIPVEKPQVKPAGPTHQKAGAPTVLATPAKGATIEARTDVTATPTVGKVFFHDNTDGKDYVCSASTVNNPTANMVSTAGHCVHHGNGGAWHSMWRFVPYYDHGATPYGVWYAHYLTTFLGWSRDGSYDWDVGFVNVWDNGGSKLINVVGGNGLRVNYSKTVYVTVMGYPAEPPFDGQWQYYCQGNTYPRWFTDQIGFDCLMTGGSSGGPFFQDYDGYLGYVNGIISNGPPETSYSPYFDTDVADLYNNCKNL